ncbi:MAG TPA: TIGR02996 domain-containing protein [Gemmataceae bacterium]|nr:TIGR02996 domain-containing protein [Gemmataceae bacterium]
MNTPTDDSAFIRAIAADPDDDAPRLVYADYLEESGDPSRKARAELIRFQVAAARERPDDPKAGETVPEQLAQTWVPTWSYSLPPIPNCKWGPYRRGFIDEVTCGAVVFFAYGGRILVAVPLRRVRLEPVSFIEVRRLLSGADIREIAELWLSGSTWGVQGALRALADAHPWPVLRRLVVDMPQVEEWRYQSFRGFDASVVLPRLRERFGLRLELPPKWRE